MSGFIRPDSKQLEATLAELSHTVSHCKFEASDASGDEVVMYRIMAVIEQCVCGEAGDRLGDIEVCEMLETVLTTCCQMRLSGMLSRYIRESVRLMVAVVVKKFCGGTLSRQCMLLFAGYLDGYGR